MNKEALKKFFEGQNYDQASIEKILGEDFTEAEAQAAAQKRLAKIETHFRGTILAEETKKAQEKGFQGGVLKTMKAINKERNLGLTNKDIERFEFDPERFAKKSREIAEAEKEELRKDADKATQAELISVKELFQQRDARVKELEETLEEQIARISREKTMELEETLGDLALQQSIPSNIDREVPGADWAVKAMLTDLKSNANIDRNGKLTSKSSNTPFIYKEQVYDTADEFLQEQLRLAGLLSKHNGDKLPNSMKKRMEPANGESKKKEEKSEALLAKEQEFADMKRGKLSEPKRRSRTGY